jgi:hypothetical protein
MATVSSRVSALPALAAPVVVFLFFSAALSGCGGVQGGLGSPGERTAVRLSAAQGEHFRYGMRQYLSSVQGVVEALSRSDRAQASGSARKAGVDMLRDVSASVAVNLPPEFLMLSMDTHQKFDALAQSAGAGESKAEMMQHLSAILANCTACHASYRFAGE